MFLFAVSREYLISIRMALSSYGFCTVHSRGWAEESFSMPGKERNGKSHGAENKRACRCSPEIFSFLQSRGSGGIGSGGKELSGEPDKQLNLGTVSSVMETLTQQPERF